MPGGETWNVESIDADGVPFNGSGTVCLTISMSSSTPTARAFLARKSIRLLRSRMCIVGSTYSITLTVPAVLTAGTYWVSVQAHMDFTRRWPVGLD